MTSLESSDLGQLPEIVRRCRFLRTFFNLFSDDIVPAGIIASDFEWIPGTKAQNNALGKQDEFFFYNFHQIQPTSWIRLLIKANTFRIYTSVKSYKQPS